MTSRTHMLLLLLVPSSCLLRVAVIMCRCRRSEHVLSMEAIKILLADDV